MATSSQSQWVINTTDPLFEADVYERSKVTLVVLDFWAQWCGPCRTLGPILESVAESYSGQFTLVKANTDETPSAATEFRVSGIPAVFAILDGNVVDSFQGAMPEPEIRSWIDRLLSEAGLVKARGRMKDSPAEAEQILRKVVGQSPNHDEAWLILAELLLTQKRPDEARQIVAQLEQRGFLEPAAQTLKAKLDLEVKSHENLEEAEQLARSNPGDHALQLTYAQALAAHGQYEASFEICLDLVAKDRKATGEKARELMLNVFRALPDDSELTRDYRRRLSMLLY